MKFKVATGSSPIIAGYIVFGIFAVFFLFLVFFRPEEWYVGIIMLSICLIGFLELFKLRRETLSIIEINDKGVLSKCYFSKDIFIDWSENTDIGVAVNPSIGPKYWLYFSKEQIPDEKYKSIKQFKMNSNQIYVQYREEVLIGVLKFVDKSRINNLYLVEK